MQCACFHMLASEDVSAQCVAAAGGALGPEKGSGKEKDLKTHEIL